MRARRVLVVSTLAVLMLAGCGSDAETPPQAAPLTTPAPSAESTPVPGRDADPVPGEGIEVAPPPTPLPVAPVRLIEASQIRPATAVGWQDAADHVLAPCEVGAVLGEGESFQRDFIDGPRRASQVVTHLADPSRASDVFAAANKAVLECGRSEFTELGWVDVGEETRMYRVRGIGADSEVPTTVLVAVYRLAGTVGAFVMSDPPGGEPEEQFAETVGRAFDPLG